jgi:hypothetical protein
MYLAMSFHDDNTVDSPGIVAVISFSLELTESYPPETLFGERRLRLPAIDLKAYS